MVLPNNASAMLPPANRSAIMPEPITTAIRKKVPSHSANNCRAMSLNLLLS
jgi:hypothetical protein